MGNVILQQIIDSAHGDVYVYGVGFYANRIIQYLGDDFIDKIKAFIITEKEETEVFCGRPVIEFSKLQNEQRGTVIIAMAKHTRVGLVEKCLKIFERVYIPEEIVPMAIFFEEENQNRNKEVADYYKVFREHTPLPQYIEIETLNRCNGKCSFCPVNANEIQRPYCKMTRETFQTIILQLQMVGYKGRLALFSNNEPFLDDRIVEFAKYAREKLPEAYIYIDTNGTIIKLDTFKEIIGYLDCLNFDIYKDNLEESDPENIKEILEYVAKNNLEKKLNVSRIDRKAIRSSRGGESPNSKNSISIIDNCPLLLLQMVFRPDGNVSLCCNDALGKFTLGNILDKSLKEIWRSEIYNFLREQIMKNRSNISLCKFCDYIDMREIYEID